MIAGLQARNNARVIFSGSFEFFSDEFFNSKVEPVSGSSVASGNKDLALAITNWCFKKSGVLKVESIAHNKKGEKSAPSHYTIKEDGKMIGAFKVPDTYGVYQFKVNYHRV